MSERGLRRLVSRARRRAAACCALLAALAACGQKGPLYLPDEGGTIVTQPPAQPLPEEDRERDGEQRGREEPKADPGPGNGRE